MDVFRVRKIRDTASSGSTTGTLDSLHQTIVQDLKDSSSMQESLRTELEALRATVSDLYATNNVESIVKANQMETRLRLIEDELQHAHPVQDYYMKNMDLLNEYYRKSESTTAVPALASRDANTFLKFFQSATPETTGFSRKQMFDEYVQRMKLSSGPDAGQRMTEHCTNCNTAREEITSEGTLVCPKCGSEEYALVVSDFPSFRDPPKERNNYAYKKNQPSQ
jgi:hypothetical protein